jgi:hypothetical protein
LFADRNLEGDVNMKQFKRYMMVIGVLAASFAGGAVSRWVFPVASQAQAAKKPRSVEDALRWSFAKPVITRKLTVGDPKGGTSALVDSSGMKIFDSRGKVRIRMESASGNMAMSDSGGKDRVKFGTIKGGDTGVAVLDKSGRPRIQLDSSGLKIFNASGAEVGIFGFQSDGTMGVSVADKSGKLVRIDIDKQAATKP